MRKPADWSLPEWAIFLCLTASGGALPIPLSDYATIVVAGVSAVFFFYGVAQSEPAWALVSTALSVLISVLLMSFTPWRWWSVLGAQVLLFVGIALFRLWREGDAPPK